jgi:hypothetical protein
LHNEGPNIVTDRAKEDEMGRACSTYRDERNSYKIFMGSPRRKRAVGRPGHRLENNNKVDLREIRTCDIDSIRMAEDEAQERGL